MRSSIAKLALAAVSALAATACVLGTQDLQALRLFFELNQTLETGSPTEVYSAVYPAASKARKPFVKLFGRLQPAAGENLPSSIDVEVVLTDLATDQSYYTFRQTVAVGADGSFAEQKKFKRDLRAGTLLTVLARPEGAPVAAGSGVALCIEVAKKKSNLSADGSCVPGGGGAGDGGGGVVVVRVVDSAFEPKRIQIQPGQTVRWMLQGSLANHTVTATDGSFDSGFTLDTAGAVFERAFGAADDGRTFAYSCVTHQACCAMQGSVQVGASAPEPPPNY